MKTVAYSACLFLLCLLWPGLVHPCFSQVVQNEILPPAPNAAALGSYGAVPVSAYTGATSITVPLATIKTKAHTLDLSLSYRSGGIRVAEEASWVGLGWTLNAGGVITRSIRGLDDLNDTNHFGFPVANPLPANNAANDYGSNPSNVSQTHADYQYFRYTACGINPAIDTEPDVFYFNFCGHSGKFVLGKSSSLNTLNVRMIENSDNSNFVFAKSTTGTAQFDSKWVVTTTDGYKYQFSDYTEGSKEESGNSDHVSAWYLNKIIAPNGEEIRFLYRFNGVVSQDFLSEYMNTVYARTFTNQSNPAGPVILTCGSASYLNNPTTYSGYNYSPAGCSWNPIDDPDVGSPMPDGLSAPNPITRSGSRVTTRGYILYKIIYANGEIEFGSSIRQDLKPIYTGSSPYSGQPYKLNDITIKSTVNNATRVVKKITLLNNSYFNQSLNLPNVDNPKAAYWRLRLDGITESGPSILGATYSFTYYPGDLPRKTTFNRDYLGYYNKVAQFDNDAGSTPNSIPKLQIFTTGLGPSPVTLPGANRDPDLTSTLIGSLLSIRYPTGGTTTFEYELHQYSQSNTPTPVKDGCGLRIKKIISTANTNAAQRIKWYTYTHPATGYCSGKMMAPGLYGFLSETGIMGVRRGDECGSNPSYRKLWLGVKRFSESTIPLSNSAQGNNYGYNVVTEWEGNDSTVANGKTVFYYHNEPETVARSPYVFNVPTQIDPLNGTVDYKIVYKRVGSVFQAVTSASYSYYATNPFPDVKGAKTNMYSFGCNIGNSFSADCEANFMLTSVKYYDVKCFWTRIASVKERIYDMNDATRSRYVETTTAYTYNTAHRQPIMIAKTLPDGTIERTYTAYPKDYLNIPSTNPVGAMADASKLHMQTVPVETYSTLTRPAGVEQLIKGQFTAFDFVGSTSGIQWVVPQRVEQIQLATPVALNSSTFMASTATSIPQSDSRYYRLQQSFGYETATGNLLRQQKPNDVLTSYQWGYANSLIEAAFVNADRTMPDASNPLLGNEASYLGFEAGQTTNQDPAADYWSIGVNRGVTYVAGDAHTGQYALRIGEVYPGAIVTGPTRTFRPTQRTARYKLSAWVKTESATFTANAGRLALRVLRANGASLPNATQEVRFSYTQGAWTYVEVTVDLGAVQQQLGLGANPEALQVVAAIDNVGDNNGNPIGYLVDDIRFQPVLAQITTYTYDLATKQPTSVSDSSNRPTYYQYDELQRLEFVRDYLNQIIQHYTYHYQR